jgi:hypothetical protein
LPHVWLRAEIFRIPEAERGALLARPD